MKLPSLVAGILLTLAASTSLSSCSLIGPHADAVLLDLAQQAENDAAMTRDPNFKAVRTTQATELKEEIMRLCGLRTDGTPYPSCAEDLSHPASSEDNLLGAQDSSSSNHIPEQSSPVDTNQWLSAARQISDDVDKVPAQSRELLTREAIELVRHAPGSQNTSQDSAIPSTDALQVIPAEDQRILEEVLRREYATVYYLGLAMGYVDDTHAPSYTALLQTHEHCAADLNAALSSVSITVSPDVSYQLGSYTSPQDDASARALADAAHDDASRHLHLAASQVSNPDIRWWLISYAGISAARINPGEPTQPGPAA